jgi:iron complex transport system ATP-binding protein
MMMNLQFEAERLPPDALISERGELDPADARVRPPIAALLSLHGAVTRLPGRRIGPFDISLRAGERVAVLGPSGAGKSTLVKLMAGERRAHEGSVRLAGVDLGAVPARDLALQRAVLPQSHAVAFGMPVELVVALGRSAREPDASQAHIVAAALDAACASHLTGRRVDTLSGGELARVQLARVLAQLWDHRDGLLLVDEPLAALDPGLQLDLLQRLRAFAEQRRHALVAVLHDVNQALSDFDRLWLVDGGRLVADLPSGRAAAQPLSALFGVDYECLTTGDGRVALLARLRVPTKAAND